MFDKMLFIAYNLASLLTMLVLAAHVYNHFLSENIQQTSGPDE